MTTELVGLLLLGCFAISGVVMLYRLATMLSLCELIGYGTATGWVVSSLMIAALAGSSGAVTRPRGELTAIVMLAVVTLLLIVFGRRTAISGAVDAGRAGRPVVRASRVLLPVLGGLLLLGWWGVTLGPAILHVIDLGVTADWVGFPDPDWQGLIPEGIGLTYPADQSPETDRPGQPVSILAALLMRYGWSPAESVAVITGGLLVALILVLFGLSVRLSARIRVGVLAVMLFVLGGGVGWILTAERINATDRPWSSLADRPWDRSEQVAAGFTVENTVLGVLVPHPQQMLVILLGILSASILLRPGAPSSRWPAGFGGLIGAGAVAVDPSAIVLILAIGLVTLAVRPAGPLTGPLRSWYDWRFGFVWALSFGLAAGLAVVVFGWPAGWRWSLRALTGGDSLPWFWLKNAGWLVPLVVIGLSSWPALGRPDRRILAMLLPAVVVAHLMAPDPATPVSAALPLTMLLVSLIAALAIETLWAEAGGLFARLLVAIVVLMTIGSGVLVNAQLWLER